MHGLIPEEPRPSTSRSIARFADSISWALCTFILYLYVDFYVDICTIFCVRLEIQNKCVTPSGLVPTSVNPGLDYTGLSSVSKRPRLVHVRQRLSCRSGWTQTTDYKRVGQICVRANAEPGTANLVLDADPCPCIGRWVPSPMVGFAGAGHHLAYRLGTSLHHCQERSPECTNVHYPLAN